jgi:hypothetical protein
LPTLVSASLTSLGTTYPVRTSQDPLKST